MDERVVDQKPASVRQGTLDDVLDDVLDPEIGSRRTFARMDDMVEALSGIPDEKLGPMLGLVLAHVGSNLRVVGPPVPRKRKAKGA